MCVGDDQNCMSLLTPEKYRMSYLNNAENILKRQVKHNSEVIYSNFETALFYETEETLLKTLWDMKTRRESLVLSRLEELYLIQKLLSTINYKTRKERDKLERMYNQNVTVYLSGEHATGTITEQPPTNPRQTVAPSQQRKVYRLTPLPPPLPPARSGSAAAGGG